MLASAFCVILNALYTREPRLYFTLVTCTVRTASAQRGHYLYQVEFLQRGELVIGPLPAVWFGVFTLF